MTRTFFMIRDRKTGLFSTGGQSPRWTKKGKVWRGIGPLKNHLRLVQERVGDWVEGKGWVRIRPEIPASWEVVEIQVREEEIGVRPAREILP